MTSQRLLRVLAVILAVVVGGLSLGCNGSAGVGIGVDYPYQPHGPTGGWGTGAWVGGPTGYR